MSKTKTTKRFTYNSLPDSCKTNYEGVFSFPSFTKEITALWDEHTTETNYYGNEVTYRTYEMDIHKLIKSLCENELNDYKATRGSYSRRVELTHSEEDVLKEKNTLNAFRSIFTWKEELFIKRTVDVYVSPESYTQESWQEDLTKEDVKDFLSGKKEFEEIKGCEGMDDYEIVRTAQNDGDFGVELEDAHNDGAGVRISDLKMRTENIPFVPYSDVDAKAFIEEQEASLKKSV